MALSTHGRLLRWYLRTNLPGRTRGTSMLARAVPAFRHLRLPIAEGQALFLDLRDPMCADVLRDSPYASHPWEPDEQEVMRRLVRAGDVVYDIGAHFGEHDALLAQLAGQSGRLIAFEPNPERHHALRRTVSQYGNADLLPYAIGDVSQVRTLFVPDFHVTASLANWTRGRVGAVREIQVEQRALDDLISDGVIPPARFIKCDVEGAEHLVFRGAAVLLDRVDAPVIMYEANREGAAAFGEPVSAATDYLRGLTAPKYAIYWVRPGGVLAKVETLDPDVGLFNLVAIPARVDAWER
jgi:FkbM family methyltransferase